MEPGHQLRNITAGGNSMPIGIFRYVWTSSELLANIYMILVNEVLGANAVLYGEGSTSLVGVYWVTGWCKSQHSAPARPKSADFNLRGLFSHHFLDFLCQIT